MHPVAVNFFLLVLGTATALVLWTALKLRKKVTIRLRTKIICGECGKSPKHKNDWCDQQNAEKREYFIPTKKPFPRDEDWEEGITN